MATVLQLTSNVSLPYKASYNGDEFERLVHNLSEILDASSCATLKDIDVENVMRHMEAYSSDKAEWQKYAFADLTRGYTRNLVDKGNGKCNLLILVWSPGKGSPIHDHADAHCVMKILQGTLRETVYEWPDAHATSRDESSSLSVTRDTVYQKDQVTYMSDQLGVHRMLNPDPNELAVSLHLYTPPNAAKHGCCVYDEASGKSNRVSQCHFYSEYGQKM